MGFDLKLDPTGLGGIFDVVGKLVDRLIPDPTIKADLVKQLNESATQLAQAQIDTNKVEAASSNFFIAGWRPACAWLCIIGLLYNAVIAPPFHLPTADNNTLWTILSGLLGLGAFRTLEKVKGVA